MSEMLSKDQAAESIRTALFRTGKTWGEVADALDKPKVWTVSALLGEQPMTAHDASTVGRLLGVDDEVVEALQTRPWRGPGTQHIPSDPTIYRFYEALAVYGPALKELMHEEFGDGIMSAINFNVDIERRADPKGDRVVVTFDGKFLDYQW